MLRTAGGLALFSLAGCTDQIREYSSDGDQKTPQPEHQPRRATGAPISVTWMVSESEVTYLDNGSIRENPDGTVRSVDRWVPAKCGDLAIDAMFMALYSRADDKVRSIGISHNTPPTELTVVLYTVLDEDDRGDVLEVPLQSYEQIRAIAPETVTITLRYKGGEHSCMLRTYVKSETLLQADDDFF